ncbi:RNA polymerase sigma factor [Dysgonomonas sp. 520]|uniref:RNA polymerase sigma factor n=1 Tax=Dysgonomonas sp. 520 TaxID=2302931 RepID=UPI0013D654FF|nr:sigma-70 family RNA polymerase sigma factor [Dysgonomonas sp. 520]NDW11109.1 sigma-70 family RNA polymerase sigma factor [Dysgonomonas sp. 520]
MNFFKKHKKEDDTDEELLNKYRNTNDSEYFGLLYNRYMPLVYGVCLKYLQNEDKAQDAVMEIFEMLLPKVAGYEIKVFKTWLYSVVKNHCFHILKENKRELTVDFDSNLMESDSVLTLLVEDVDTEREKALNKCLEKLPEPQRIAVYKFFFEDMSYAEIVENTGFHLKSVKSYIQNGKRNLKNCIESSVKEE